MAEEPNVTLPVPFHVKSTAEDFTWRESLVILRPKGEPNRRLRTRKEVLARESTYFYNLFYFSGSNTEFNDERNQEFLVPVDYETLKKVLSLVNGNKTYVMSKDEEIAFDELESLYIASGVLEIPRIRKPCLDELRKMAMKSEIDEYFGVAVTLAVRLGLYDIFVELRDRDSSENIVDFFKGFHKDGCPNVPIKPCLSKADVPWFHDLLFPDTPFRHHRPPRRVIRLEDVAVIPQNLRHDITQRWGTSDVCLRTWNSNGVLLHSKKKDLATVSSYFDNLFFGRNARRGKRVFNIDVEFVTMREILWLIHCLVPEYEIPSAVLLYDIFLSTGEDQLDILQMHNWCCEYILSGNFNTLDAVDVANKLGADDLIIGVIEIRCSRNEQDFDAWINGRQLVYMRGGQEVDVTSSNTKKLLSLNVFFNTYPIKRNK